jgi:hypothetical protein
MSRARALADYDGVLPSLLPDPLLQACPLRHSHLAGDASAGILSFKQGDVLIITEQQDSGWWIADLNGASGVVPSTCAPAAALPARITLSQIFRADIRNIARPNFCAPESCLESQGCLHRRCLLYSSVNVTPFHWQAMSRVSRKSVLARPADLDGVLELTPKYLNLQMRVNWLVVIRYCSLLVTAKSVPSLAARNSEVVTATSAERLHQSSQEIASSWTPLELVKVEKAFRSCNKHYVQDRR